MSGYISLLLYCYYARKDLQCAYYFVYNQARARMAFLYKLNLARKTKEKRFYGLSLVLKISFITYIEKCKDKCVRYTILNLKIPRTKTQKVSIIITEKVDKYESKFQNTYLEIISWSTCIIFVKTFLCVYVISSSILFCYCMSCPFFNPICILQVI